MFKLSDTYGFPLDFAVDLANEKELSIDYKGFNHALEEQKITSRPPQTQQQKAMQKLENIDSYETQFTGYNSLEESTKLLAIYIETKEVPQAMEADECLLVCEKTPFYAESGGQVGDSGIGKGDGVLCRILDTRKTNSGVIFHKAIIKKGTIRVGDTLDIKVDNGKRRNIAAHHSTTHLLHTALREVLGLHVKQAGSYVGPDKLRFDFTHFKALSAEEIPQVETLVNAKIRENIDIETHVLKYEEAIQRGAIAFFEEKYTDVVRMLSIGDFSRELCGGTHLKATGEAGFFKIVNESSISSGIRRVEAVAGESGYAYSQQIFDGFRSIQTHFSRKEDQLFDFLVTMEKNLKEKEKQLKKQAEAKAEAGINLNSIIAQGTLINGVSTVIHHLEGIDRKRLSSLADELKAKNRGVAVLSANINEKSAIIVSVDKELTRRINANKLIKEVAAAVNGKGGGRPDFAQAGGDVADDPQKFKKYRPNCCRRLINYIQYKS